MSGMHARVIIYNFTIPIDHQSITNDWFSIVRHIFSDSIRITLANSVTDKKISVW